MTKRPVPLPSKQEVIDFIRSSPGRIGKRELARAFHLSGEQRIWIKAVLKELEQDGTVERGTRRRYAQPGTLPDYTVAQITSVSVDGELEARPVSWKHETPPPSIHIIDERKGETVGIGDRALVKLHRVRDGLYDGRIVRRLSQGPSVILGVFGLTETGEGRLYPADRRQKADFLIATTDTMGAEPGELVSAEVLPGRGYGLRRARIVERLGDMNAPRSISLLVIHANGIPFEFSDEAVAQAEAAIAAPMDKRDDLRSVPLVTIDGEDARDFDDAVWAEADSDPENPGGWHALVAIADVAWYVRPNDSLDKTAFERGNSVYFPDRVVPMLPEPLSNGWCSLRPGEDRPCMALHLWIDAEGRVLRHRFVRAMMRSAARLTYNQVQNALDGSPDAVTAPLLEKVLHPLYRAWQALQTARRKRGVLELDLPERQVVLDENSRVVRISPRARYDSHRLIEDFMITANVAAAQSLESLHQPCMYRIHDRPSPEKVESLSDFLATLSLSIPRDGNLRPKDFNRILEQTASSPQAHLISEIILRSQAQAAYNPENIGHFGLGLKKYAHFTSPIRRYADLLVHRALITGLSLGEGGLPADTGTRFADIGVHISTTERRAANAERDAVNRYTVAFLSDQEGAVFAGRISGVTASALFVELDETGADGIVPISLLPNDHYVYDKAHHSVCGLHSRLSFSLGDAVEARLREANALTGSLVFEIVTGIPSSGGRTIHKPSVAKKKASQPKPVLKKTQKMKKDHKKKKNRKVSRLQQK